MQTVQKKDVKLVRILERYEYERILLQLSKCPPRREYIKDDRWSVTYNTGKLSSLAVEVLGQVAVEQ